MKFAKILSLIIPIIILFICGGITYKSFGQQWQIHEVMESERSNYDSLGSQAHTSVRPLTNDEIKKYSCKTNNYSNSKNLLSRYINNHCITLNKNNFNLTQDVLFDGIGKYEFSNNNFSNNLAIGTQMIINYGKHITAGGYGKFHQCEFDSWVQDYANKYNVAPGAGYVRSSSLSGNYYWDWEAYITYGFMKYFNLEGGMGRNFWGDGYRSLLLSDNSFSYPYIKLTTTAWKIKYTNLYTSFKSFGDLSSSRWNSMENKFGSFHFLSWNISKRLNIGFFEAIIWQEKDSTMNRGLEVNYLSPVIFFRPVEFSIGSPDNSLLGGSFKYKFSKRSVIYGQFIIDDIIVSEFRNGIINRIKTCLNSSDTNLIYGYWTNKQAFQIGIRSYDIFKVNSLDIQLEYNYVRPYTFSHRRVIVNYSHYNEPLTHPLGANFKELTGFLRYNHGKLFYELQISRIVVGIDSTGTHYGQNIFQSTFDSYKPELDNIPVTQYYNSTCQGIKTNILYGALRTTYLINPSNNFRFVLEIAFKKQSSSLDTKSGLYIGGGLKTSWRDCRKDF